MPRATFPHLDRHILANDGDELQFCSTCAFSQACLGQGLDKSALGELHMLVEHVGPLHAGDVAFRRGEPFVAIAAVRAGTIRTSTIDRDGREQVLGFHLPGEVIGLGAIADGRYPCDAVALDTAMLCRFSFREMAALATRLPGLQQELFRMLSRDLGAAARLAGDHPAEERLAGFLVDLSRRLHARGFAADRFALTMSRIDIGNYLRLTPETISRLLRRFEQQGLLRIERRDVIVRDPARLHALAAAVLGD